MVTRRRAASSAATSVAISAAIRTPTWRGLEVEVEVEREVEMDPAQPRRDAIGSGTQG